jgi:phosphatidylserine/phosphatidylglycerophosphate/cardiolipin synthase-like enzyme
MNSVFVKIPCRRFGVSVVLGPPDGLTDVDQFILRSVAAKAETVDALHSVLRLDRRIVADACIDMLRAGLLLIEPETGRIELSPHVLDAMGDPVDPRPGWARQLVGGRPPESRQYQMLQELAGGGVLPATRDGRWQPTSHRAPQNDRLPLVTDIQKPQLMTAVGRSLRRRLEDDINSDNESRRTMAQAISRQRILDVQVVPNDAPGGLDTASDVIVVEMARRPSTDEDRPDLVVVGPRSIPASIRHGIARGLSDLWDRGYARGKDQFFGRLLSTLEAVEVDVSPADESGNPHEAVERFANAVKEAAAVGNDGEALARAHLLIEDAERRAREEVDDAASDSASAELVESTARQHDLLLEALRTARDQVVLTCPWVGRLDVDEGLRDALADAVSRGVRVHVLWGIGRDTPYEEAFGPAARDLVEALSPGHGLGGLFVARRSAAIHAKLVVCDMDWMLVSTANLLNSSRNREECELAFRVRGPMDARGDESEVANSEAVVPGEGRAPVARVLRTALRWTRGLVPDFQIQRLMVEDPVLAQRRALAPSVDLDVPMHAPAATDLGRGVWLRGWEKIEKRLREKLKVAGTVVQPLHDTQHRRALFDAITGARQRLVVSSPYLGTGLLGTALMPHLRTALERGVDVVVMYGKEDSPDVAARRRELSDMGARFISRKVHAKVLVCDGWAAVSSFNFLSFEGYYDNQKRARHEFGVRVFGADMADAVVAALMRAPPV